MTDKKAEVAKVSTAGFKGQTVLITGANKGIGLHMAQEFSALGARVVGVCRNTSDGLKKVSKDIYEGVSVEDVKKVDELVASLTKANIKIDVLVNNAGVLQYESPDKPDYDFMRKSYDVNAIAPIIMSLALLKADRFAAKAKIVIISTLMASIGDPRLFEWGLTGFYSYKMSKAAVNMAGFQLAHDLKSKGIAVGLYHPGTVWTDMAVQAGMKENMCVTPEKSAKNLLQRMAELSLETSGKFVDAGTNEIIVW
jgi:NAD(P)-dependent dehydrogenase (short-subunit alcohol dehydrogenase family)